MQRLTIGMVHVINMLVSGIRKMALPQISNLMSGVRFSYPAPNFGSVA